jgi:ubiquinone/menaquinone biosynthesis C-methylase UbiE
MTVEVGIKTKSEWDKKWNEIFNHYQQDTRHAYYINAILDNNDKKLLEIGAGSFRDTALLNTMGIDCWGTDYSDTSIKLAKSHFPALKKKIFRSNAFDMNKISDKFFDVTFHNGFWVLFDNNSIIKLAQEQARITRNKVIATVHNAHNKDFINYFQKLSQTDPLYKIKFFTIDEIRALMLTVCKDLDVIPVGKGKKYLEDEMINGGNVDKKEMRTFFKNAELRYLEQSERLLCVGYLT